MKTDAADKEVKTDAELDVIDQDESKTPEQENKPDVPLEENVKKPEKEVKEETSDQPTEHQVTEDEHNAEKDSNAQTETPGDKKSEDSTDVPTSEDKSDDTTKTSEPEGDKSSELTDEKTEVEEPPKPAPPASKPRRSLWGWGARRQETVESIEVDKKVEKTEEKEEKAEEKGEQKDQSEEKPNAKDEPVNNVKEEEEADDNVELVPGHTYRIEMSLCGLAAFGKDEEENANVFKEHQVTYDAFTHNPNILNDRRLVFRYEDRYYSAGKTGPLFTSLLLFKRPVEESTSPDSEDEDPTKVSDRRETYQFGKGWRQWLSRSSVAAPTTTENNETAEVKDDEKPQETTTFTTTMTTTSVGWTADHTHPDGEPDEAFAKPQKVYAKTLRLTSDQLKSLNLKKGPNTVSFTVTSAYWGTAVCAAKIFYWDYNIQIVISDIDGTITKSDALGHVFSMIGKDWTHLGVAKLYTGIANNGYHFLYLTSRAIGQADYTRDYLKRIIQDKYQLPDGPVIMSPDRLFTSLHREVIIRKPEVFKMACLRDVQRLFGGRDPFYAGFGNRITDARSYRSVNVPTSRIFTIDPYGELKLELLLGFKSSYIHLQDLVDQIFPPINDSVNEEFNDINYWKAPIPDVELPELEDLPEPKSPKPRPIKPDLHALPPESVLSSTNTQRGLLRSLTSRTSTDTTKYKPISNASAPSLLLSRKVSGYSDDSLINDQKASAVMEGENDHADTSSIVSTSPPDSVKSGSIMNKMRTTLSRTFLLSSEHGNEKFVDKISEVVSLDSTHEDSKESPEDDEENKEDMDDILDSINMDDIPFI
ncbi:Lipin/Ned1/Smp2-domain-containing protein [Pilobolus umbonatus]|nr:Lipin/Ned1/Smp2-domain-containing protein [Pilobolus umbonatus]